MRFARRTIALGLGAGLLLMAAGTASANAPQVYTWTNDVDTEYFDCGTFVAHGVWSVSHVLTIYTDTAGTPLRDREKVEFSGAFVNPVTGASIRDSGQIIYFDDLTPTGDYAATWSNVIRKSAYFKVAGRTDFQTFEHHGVDRFDVSIPAACAALGA